MNANDVMTVRTYSCTRHDSLDQVARLMWDHNCGAIPVVDDERHPVGIITDRDIAMTTMLNHRPQWELTAGELIADQKLHTCAQDESVENCLATMEKYSIRRLPVIDAAGRLTGIISMGDAIAFTSNSAGRSKSQQQLPPKQTLAMLKAVSAHHANAGGAVVAAR